MKRMAKNDNLKNYQNQRVLRNTALIERAISHIRGFGGNISMSIVSKVTYEIADMEKEEKGITLAGISKNKTYRNMVEQAKVAMQKHKNNGSGGVAQDRLLTGGDIRMMLHAVRVENEKLKQENRILLHQLQDMPSVIETTEPIQDKLIKEHNELYSIARSLVSRLCELEIAYIDLEDDSLKLLSFGDVIVSKSSLEKFYTKELHDLKTSIH